jgi:hypothetical protein
MWKPRLDVEKTASFACGPESKKCVIESAKAGCLDTQSHLVSVEGAARGWLLTFFLGRRQCMLTCIARPPKSLNAQFKPC